MLHGLEVKAASGRLIAAAVGLTLGLSIPAASQAETIVVRSGFANGAPIDPRPQLEDDIRCLAGPHSTPLRDEPFTADDFAAARTGPLAWAIVPLPPPIWPDGATVDPLARWINPANNHHVPQNALYHTTFTVQSPCIDLVQLTLRWRVDDTIGDLDGEPNPYGVYINEQPAGAAFRFGGTEAVGIVTSLVRPGVNDFYIYQRDTHSSDSGLIFSATFEVYGDIRAGNVNTGDGSPRQDILFVNGTAGNLCREVTVTAGTPARVDLLRPASLSGKAHWILWIYDGDWSDADSADIVVCDGQGSVSLGRGVRPLPVMNTCSPGTVPCPVTFPLGRTSRSFGPGAAGQLCVPAGTALPKAPYAFMQAFPPGDFLIGAIVQDDNAPAAPRKPAAITNWIVLRSVP
jgi:hypothetical protein